MQYKLFLLIFILNFILSSEKISTISLCWYCLLALLGSDKIWHFVRVNLGRRWGKKRWSHIYRF